MKHKINLVWSYGDIIAYSGRLHSILMLDKQLQSSVVTRVFYRIYVTLYKNFSAVV